MLAPQLCECSTPVIRNCPWDSEKRISSHRLQFHFEHDPRFEMFRSVACTTEGHNMISYLLQTHEAAVTEWCHSHNEALIYYVAHQLYITLVVSKSEALARQKAAANGEEIDPIEFEHTALYRAPSLGGLKDSPFGRHFTSLMYSQGLSAVSVDCRPMPEYYRGYKRYGY